MYFPGHLHFFQVETHDIIFLGIVQNVLWTRCVSSFSMASRSSTCIVIQQTNRLILIDGIKACRIRPDRETMPSLFGPEEAQYDRYAACLAATEGLRRIRDKKLGSRRFFIRDTEEMSEAQRRINTEYILHSSKVLEAMGITNPNTSENSQQPLGIISTERVWKREHSKSNLLH